MLSKSELKHGEYYYGHCRNASVARWNGQTSKFIYLRYKFGESFYEDIRHPEDFEGYDTFEPERVVDWCVDALPLEF